MLCQLPMSSNNITCCLHVVAPVVHHHEHFVYAQNTVLKNDPLRTLALVLHPRYFQENPSGTSALLTNAILCWQTPQSLLFIIKRCSVSHVNQHIGLFISPYSSRHIQSNSCSRLRGITNTLRRWWSSCHYSNNCNLKNFLSYYNRLQRAQTS